MIGWIVCAAFVTAGPTETPNITARRAWPIELRAITLEAEVAAATVRFGAQHGTVLALKKRLELLEDAKRDAPTEDGSDQAMLAGELHLLDSRLLAEITKLKATGKGDQSAEVMAIAREREVVAKYMSGLPALEIVAESGPPAVVRAVVEEAVAQGRVDYLRGLYGPRHPEVVAAEERLAEASRVIARSRVTDRDREAIRGALTAAFHERLDVVHNPQAGRDDALIEAELDGLAMAHARLAMRRFAGD